NIKRKNQISSFLRKSGVNALFTIGELGANFSLPLLSWIPDFQHLHFPDFFSEEENSRRNRTFARSARHAKRIIVSSKSCYEDLRSFAPWALDKARVLPFVAQIPSEVYNRHPKSICSKYNIPERYILLPNQFWKHKNHKVVIEALEKSVPLCPDLTIVCTGNTNEERDQSYFGHLLGLISRAGVREQMVLLGLVPRDDLFSLMRQSMAVLQPSLFEGWSTTVEEVKSLGKSIIVSDIPVHREQGALGAHYFDPHDADSLADCLAKTFLSFRPGPDMKMEELARESLRSRTSEFGRKFVEIVKEMM
ncbi:MAG TPA: glycosyltransferase, partial [candidate division Zixibacteria bacterium]|nr:glycosyltransferase [candidate division Zixibacteria bacterium]